MAQFVLEQGGIVFGAAFDDNFNVIHKSITIAEQLPELYGSKYVQSIIGDSYKLTERYLREGRLVLFSGTPCQVAGLKKYLQKDYLNLITVDLVCHGVPSPLLWQKYKDFCESKYGASILGIRFRDKSFGYAGSTMAVDFDNGVTDNHSFDIKSYKRAYFKGISSRKSCYSCPFKSLNRASDLTLFDCWSVNHFEPEWDDDHGTTAILVHSKRGYEIVKAIRDKARIMEVNTLRLIELDGRLAIENDNEHEKRDLFCEDINKLSYEDLMEQYLPITKKERVVSVAKPALYKLGKLSSIKRKFS